MKQFFILIFLLSAFAFVSEAQSKINFEESEVEFVFELEDLIASNGLINTDTLLMKSEHEEAIDVDWFLTYDLPIQDSMRVWGIGLCNETSCFFSESSANLSEFDVTTVPPNYTYSWKFSLVTGDLFDNTDWFLGEGSAILSVVNKADRNDSTSIKVNLKMIDSAAIVEGCTDSTACNYNMDATEDDGSCKLVNDTCLSENGDEGVLNEACSCVTVMVCTDEDACNTGEDGDCLYLDCLGECGGNAIPGTYCQSPIDANGVYGEDCTCIINCGDENACNNGEAGDCLYVDCAGECGGSVVEGSICTDANGNEGMIDDECNCVEVLSVDEFSLLSKSIFPNPSTGLINLQLKDANHSITTLRVNNVQGQQVFSLDDLEPNTSYQFDISNLVKGLYQIQLFNKEGYLLHAEIVERQ